MERLEALAIRDATQSEVCSALVDLYGSRGFDRPGAGGVRPADELHSFEVSPVRSGWCLAFPDAPAAHDEDARELSARLGCPVLLLRTSPEERLTVLRFDRGADDSSRHDWESLGSTSEGSAEATRILEDPADPEPCYRFGEALGIEGLRDYEQMMDALIDQEEAGYRRLVLRRSTSWLGRLGRALLGT